MREKTTRSIFIVFLLGAIALTSANTYLAYRSVRVMNEGSRLVSHTWEVQHTLDLILAALEDAETGNRGYLLIGNPVYLEPYTRAVAALPEQMDTLQHLTQDNPTQQVRIQELRRLVRLRLDILETEIAERKQGQQNFEHLTSSIRQGKVEMDQLRGLVAQMQQTERGLLTRRRDVAERSMVRARFTVLIAGVLDLLMILVAFRYLLRERQLRVAARIAADRLARLQAISDVGLTELSFGDMTQALLQRIRDVIQADNATLCMWRDGEIEIAAANGINLEPGHRIQLDPEGPLAEAARTGRMVALIGHARSALLTESLDEKTQSLLVIRLATGGRTIGLLVAGRHTASAFAEVDEQLFSVVADRIATSLDRANAYHAEREARRLAEANAEQIQLLNAELEDRVRQRTTELEATNRELEAFSYSVSHDLRAPLRSVDGFSLALQEDFNEALDDAGRDYIRRIRAGVQRMGMLIDSLLQLSRITRAELARETMDLSVLAEDLASELRLQEENRHVTFRIQPGLTADADPRLLRVALQNLLGNAVKFSSKVDDPIVEVGRTEDSGEFYVRDNGAGFDMKYAPKLFTAFQRLHGDKDFMGSGIGLATVARVIRRHHGEIRAEGEVGKGATFWFTLG